jgi:hypothetical protein
MYDTSASDLPAEARASTRRDVVIRASLRDRTSTRQNIEVMDLSASGFRAVVDYSIDAGAIVWLKLPNFAALEAKVAWRRGDIIGAAFINPLHPAVFDHITR